MRKKYPIKMLISGGQTGVDRAALDFALYTNILCGGWCPRGRRAEDGTIPKQYPLIEASTTLYQQRTALNVRDSDATLIINDNINSKGTALTIKTAQQRHKPLLIVELQSSDFARVRRWLWRHHPEILNVAGPRESESFSAYDRARAILSEVIVSAGTTQVVWPPIRPFTADLLHLNH